MRSPGRAGGLPALLTEMVQATPAANVFGDNGHVDPFTAKSPVVLMAVIVSGIAWLLVKVTVGTVAAVVFTAVEAKVRLAGLTVVGAAAKALLPKTSAIAMTTEIIRASERSISLLHFEMQKLNSGPDYST